MTELMEFVILEELFNEELKCEANHSVWDQPNVCSVKVVARKTVECDGGAFFICQTSYDTNIECFESGYICDCCKRPCKNCWKLIPV